jgi:hypothetical protein
VAICEQNLNHTLGRTWWGVREISFFLDFFTFLISFVLACRHSFCS